MYPCAIFLQDVINSAYKCNAAATERMSCEQPSVEMVDCSDIVKLLYRAAKRIKLEIADCHDISIRPPSVVDSEKSKVPHSRQPLLVTALGNCQIGKRRRR